MRGKWIGQLKGVHGILSKGEKNGLVNGQLKRCCHGMQRKGEKSDLVSSRLLLGILRKGEKKVAWSAQGCCHGILRKGEKSGLVSSGVLSWDTEEKREKWLGQLKGVVTGY